MSVIWGKWGAMCLFLLACAAPNRQPVDIVSPPVPEKIPLWELPPVDSPDRPVVPSNGLHRWELKNGLEVIFLEDHRLPFVELGVTIKVGAASESIEEAGLAVFTADLIEKGAGDLGALELSEKLETLGATFGVSASWDSSTVSTTGLARDFSTLIDVLGDLVLRPKLSSDEARRAREELLALLEREKDDPGSLASRAFLSALYNAHRYSAPLSGVSNSIKNFTEDNAREFHDRFFRPSNAIFFATGKIKPKVLREKIENIFGSWKGSVPEISADAILPPESKMLKIVIIDRPDLSQAQVRIGHQGIGRTDSRRLAASLMNLSFGGAGFSSRLMSRIRGREGLAYGVYSYFTLRRNPGPFVISTATRFSEVRRVVDLVLFEMERLKREPPSGQELASMKSLSTGRFSLRLETSSALLSSLVDLSVYSLPADSLDTFRDRVMKTTEGRVSSVAQSLLRPESLAIAIVGPAKAIRAQLSDLGAVEVFEP